MGDLISNLEIFKKLNFNTTNQWIFYDERFNKFFDFFVDYITDNNVLLETQVLDHEEYVKRGEYLDGNERRARLDELEKEYPNLTGHTPIEISDLTHECQVMEVAYRDYNAIVGDMRETKNLLNFRINRQEERFQVLRNKERELLTECQSKAKQLEKYESENYKKCGEIIKTYSKMQSPPLFMHQLPLDQYFVKCDTFTQYLTLYMKENYKIQEFIDNESSLVAQNQNIAEKLQFLETNINEYTMASVVKKAKSRGIITAIDALNNSQVHVRSLSDMERETSELANAKLHLDIAYQTLMLDLQHQVHLQTQQTIELILYENTKQKLERALSRQENDEGLTKIMSDALSNAELIWMLLQLDIEKKRNRFDNTEQLNTTTQHCLQRIQHMKCAKSPGIRAEFVQQLSSILSHHLQQQIRCDVKSCLYEYEKFNRLLEYALQGLLNGKSYSAAIEKLKELNRIEAVLHPFVYDSPVDAPMFKNANYLRPIYNVKTCQSRIEKQFRQLRTEFRDNITERLEKDKFSRYSQLLWIWFLTEPRRVLHAIEEAKKAASKVPQVAGIKALVGIKRK